MKYQNAKHILPNDLLMMLQQYVEGTCLYIPSAEKRSVRAITNEKLMQRQRNEQIKHDYESGVSVTEIAQRYYLSKQAIYKILKCIQ